MKQLNLPFLHKVIALCICTAFGGCSKEINTAIASNNQRLEDGIYLIHRTGNKNSEILPVSENEKIITFKREFYKNTDVDVKYIVINTKEFAPILLKEKPKTEEQEDKRKKLLLVLADEAKNELREFTSKHLNKLTTIVIGGEALTMHKIKVVIDSGLLQVTRCTDNACELLYFELQDNIIQKD